MRVTVKQIGTTKRAPQWGQATVNEIERVLREDSRLKAAPKEIVQNWSRENRPKFETVVGHERGAITVGYRVTGSRKARQIWDWLNEGTSPHKIRAKNAPTLAFTWGGPGSYRPKTKPGGATLQFGGPGTVSGGTMHFPKEVNHPGFEGRDFYGYLGNRLATHFRYLIQRAVRVGLRKGRTLKL